MKVYPKRSDELLSRMMVGTILYGLKSIGLAPISLQSRSGSGNSGTTSIWVFLFSKLGLFYNLVFSILIQTMSALMIRQYLSESYPNQSSLTQAMDVLSEVFLSCTSWLIIVYWGFGQRRAAAILNRIVRVHRLLSDSNRESFMHLTVHVVLSISVWITCLVTTAIFYNSILKACFGSVTTFVVYWFFVEYAIILALVAGEIHSLNNNLLKLRQFRINSFPILSVSQSSVLNLSIQSQLAVLELLQGVSMSLFDVSQSIADFFSLPVLLAVGSFFITFIYDVYFLIIPILAPVSYTPLNTHINSVARAVLSIYPLILLSFNVAVVTAKAKLTGRIVNRLLTTTRNKEIIEQLEQFSGQLIHEDISFTAHGFFSLDFTLIQSILGATVTYLVIIIQFMNPPETKSESIQQNSTILSRTVLA